MTDTANDPTDAPVAGDQTTAQPATGEVLAVMQELGLEPGQLAERLKASRKWEERAKSNSKAAEELEQLRQQSMSEQERAVAQARAEARAEALTETASRIAAAELRAAAAGRLGDDQLKALLEGDDGEPTINLARFVTDDGDVDRSKVAQFVEGIAPPPQEQQVTPSFPDLGQGARTNAMALNGDPLLSSLKSKLGING